MEEMIGVIKLFAGDFAPRGFLLCDGSLLNIQTNTALFSILGTTYGGDGVRTFALPNLKGRYPIGTGNVNANEYYPLGVQAGTTQTTITTQNLPSFISQVKVSKANANSASPSSSASIGVTGNTVGRDFTAIPSFVNGDPDTVINAKSVSFVGQNVPINNMPPYLGLNYIICVEGIYPSRQ